MKSLCVFCGSSPGRVPAYADAAREVGRLLAAAGIELVFGGGSVGLMGILADATLEAGGRAVGIIPRHLWDREVGHGGLSELHIVESMHERKALMAELSDGFLALPGGIGTLEEFFEVWTWGQLGLHAKPYGLLDVHGYFRPLVRFLDHAVEERFVKPEHRAMVVIEDRPDEMLRRLREHRPPVTPKWIDLETT
ncbi:MAG TPA: TIGR00730 family Rossman fold protein [Longimicrobiales bacterium]|nr:TIGR00730 family Rossman fold protein [Longimicrobiales bacterium]